MQEKLQPALATQNCYSVLSQNVDILFYFYFWSVAQKVKNDLYYTIKSHITKLGVCRGVGGKRVKLGWCQGFKTGMENFACTISVLTIFISPQVCGFWIMWSCVQDSDSLAAICHSASFSFHSLINPLRTHSALHFSMCVFLNAFQHKMENAVHLGLSHLYASLWKRGLKRQVLDGQP